MTATTDRLESRLYRHFWDDGLLDLFAGVGVVGIGVCWALDLVAIGAVVPAVLVPFWIPLRRALIEPRSGFVEFSDTRVDHNRRLLAGSVALGAASLAVFAALYLIVPSDPAGWLVRVIPGVPALLLALLAAFTGLALGLPRFLAHAAVLAVAGAAVVAADAAPEEAMIAGGALVAIVGAWLLRRFLQMPVEMDDTGGAT